MLVVPKDNNEAKALTQKDVMVIVSEAYDQGGMDVLRLVAATVKDIGERLPDAADYVGFTLSVLEGVRQTLAEAVSKADPDPESSRIVTV